jgi:hypothetical protein
VGVVTPLPIDVVVGPANPLIEDGYRRLTAREWARGAHLDPDEAAAATMLASEASWDEVARWPQYGRQIVRAARREAISRGVSLCQLIAAEGTRAPGAGRFGPQSGRYCASSQRALHAHLAMVREVLAEPAEPLEQARRGARWWVHLKTQDGGKQGGKPLRFNAEGIVRRRWLQRLVWVGPLPDVAPYVLMLFRQRRDGDTLEPALEVVAAGRKQWRWKPPA